jgi:hypothetical protein
MKETMKARNFYPRQVLRKLQGEHKQLDAGQLAALRYVTLKGRKLGISLMSGTTATPADLAGAMSKEAAAVMLANANTRITLRPAF